MLGKYYKAILATLGILATGLASAAADNDINAVLPAGSGLVTAALTVVGGAVVFLTRNKQTIDQIDKAIEAGEISIADLQTLQNKWKQDR